MLQKTTRPRLSAMETQAASPPLRCIIVYKTRSRVWLFLFFCSFLQYNPGVLVFFIVIVVTPFDPFALFYNEMVTVGKYRDRKSGTIANLQEYGTTGGVLILSMRVGVCRRRVVLFWFFFLVCFFFSIYFSDRFYLED